MKNMTYVRPLVTNLIKQFLCVLLFGSKLWNILYVISKYQSVIYKVSLPPTPPPPPPCQTAARKTTPNHKNLDNSPAWWKELYACAHEHIRWWLKILAHCLRNHSMCTVKPAELSSSSRKQEAMMTCPFCSHEKEDKLHVLRKCLIKKLY